MLTISSVVVKALNPPSQSLQLLIRLYVSFFVSGLIHSLGDVPLLDPSLPLPQRSGSLIFFLLQAVGITIELAFATLLHTAQSVSNIRVPTAIKRGVGYLWVVAWLSVTLGFWVEPEVRAGFIEDGWHPRFARSIADALKAKVRLSTTL